MITTKPFGNLSDGTAVTLYCIKSGNYSAGIMDFGATLVNFCCPDKNGNETDVLLGFDDVTPYTGSIGYMGAVIGRFGNRIEGGKFTLNGKEYKLFINNGPNHLHGGEVGFSHRMFKAEVSGENSVTFCRISPDGEEGYPGNLRLCVTYTLQSDGTLSIDYLAVTDKDTVINLTNHAYFNLNGADDPAPVYDHFLRLDASAFCETDEHCLANGNIIAVRGTPFDFRTFTKLGDSIKSDYAAAVLSDGIDHNFVLNGEGYRQFGELYCEKTGILMTCFTDQPGVQIYTGNGMNPIAGKSGKKYCKHGAVCLETQGFPNSTSFEHFPSPVLKKGDVYHHVTAYKLSLK